MRLQYELELQALRQEFYARQSDKSGELNGQMSNTIEKMLMSQTIGSKTPYPVQPQHTHQLVQHQPGNSFE